MEQSTKHPQDCVRTQGFKLSTRGIYLLYACFWRDFRSLSLLKGSMHVLEDVCQFLDRFFFFFFKKNFWIGLCTFNQKKKKTVFCLNDLKKKKKKKKFLPNKT